MGFFEHNGGSIHYEDVGSGPPVVLIHGFALDRRVWRHQVPSLSAGFRVITYDCRGFGRSSSPAGAYSHHDDLHHLLRHLGVARPHLAGLSMGGRIALNYALAWPRSAQSLTLIGSDVGGYQYGFDWDAGLGALDLAAAKAVWLRHELFRTVRRHPGPWELVRAMVADYSGWHWRNRDIRLPPDTGAITRLAEIRERVEVVVGALDLADFQRIGRVLVARIPGAHRTVLPGVGHMVGLEAPDAVNELLLRQFIGGSRKPVDP